MAGKAQGSGADSKNLGVMIAGVTTNPFQLALTNPLYDPIQVRLSPQRVTDGRGFQVSLPLTPFSIGAFAEAWEYDDDEDMFGVEDDELGLDGGRGTRDKGSRGKTKTVGVLERRANVTVVGGEVNVHRTYRGEIKVCAGVTKRRALSHKQCRELQFNMLVSYTYRSDDPLPSEDGAGTPSRTVVKSPEVKTFSFYTVVDLGPVVAKEEKADPEAL